MLSRRNIVLAGVLILALAVLMGLIVPGGRPVDPDPRPSTLGSGPHGLRALYLALRALEVRAEPRFSPLVDAPEPEGALALIAPSESPTPGELAALLHWVRGGGNLLYVARPGDATLDSLGLRLRAVPAPSAADEADSPATRDMEAEPALPRPHPWTAELRGVRGVDLVFAARSPALRRPGARPLLARRGGGVAAALLPVGKGRVLVWSDVGPLRNQNLRDSGAAPLFARAATELAGDGPLRFDEFHHGHRGNGSAVRGTWRFLTRTHPGYLVLQWLAVAALALLLVGARFGEPRPLPRRSRRSPLEHVDALARLYRQAGARATTRRLLLSGLARRLGMRAPDAATPHAVVQRARSSPGASRATAQRLEQQWEDGAEPAALAQTIDDLLAEVKRT